MFPITVTIHNPAQLNAVMSALTASDKPSVTDKLPEPKVEAITPISVATPKGDANAKKSSPPRNKTKLDPTPGEETTAYDKLFAAFVALSMEKGRDAGAAVLNQFGVKKLPFLQPEQYADVLAACEAARDAT